MESMASLHFKVQEQYEEIDRLQLENMTLKKTNKQLREATKLMQEAVNTMQREMSRGIGMREGKEY